MKRLKVIIASDIAFDNMWAGPYADVIEANKIIKSSGDPATVAAKKAEIRNKLIEIRNTHVTVLESLNAVEETPELYQTKLLIQNDILEIDRMLS